ncbi:MAG: phosphate ABC transporter substrate-binding protein PstS [Steroidobacteraceae bacterium]
MKSGPARRRASLVLTATLAICTAFGAQAAMAQQRLLETGSSLLYPLFNLWVPVYAKTHRGVQITTQSTGSGTGIAEAVSGIAQIGASDAYMSDPLVRMHPTMLNIPLAISSQMINYNVPGLNNIHLKLSGPVLAAMYSGRVRFWDDPMIARLNPGVRLPHKQIVLVHRTDGSGDTFIFTQYLSFSTPSWNNTVSYGTTVSWPAVEGGIGAEGNPGMVNACKGTPYSVAYIGISYKQAIEAAHLGEAAIENRSGNFVLPGPRTVQAAVEATASHTPRDERISLIFAPGKWSYPIINYEYAIVNARQPDAQAAAALREFFNWALSPTEGNSERFMKEVGFVALPAPIVALSKAQIARIQ